MADACIDAEQSAIAVVHCGDMRQALASMRCESVDAIVTDPPYGLSFMSKEWDQQVPGPDYWRAVLRVAKPGAHLLAFGGTRTAHRLACAIEDAGWEIRDCLSWLYGSGFPKSHDVSKAIDRDLGAEREVIGKSAFAARANKEPKGMNPGGGSRNVEDTRNITAPATAAARAWSGWGTALKPAWEPIYLARKPFKRSVSSNVVEHGCGALNIDGCRIASGELLVRPAVQRFDNCALGRGLGAGVQTEPLGRWPANLVLDETAAAMLDAQTGVLKSGALNAGHRRGEGATSYSGGGGVIARDYGNDSGGASRFFYTAKAPRAEREAGLDRFEARSGCEVTGRATGSAGAVASAYAGTTQTERRNIHPTVKPVSLMRWLVRLVTPPNAVVLDPFTGSGSTGVAAVLEGVRFIGIELQPEFAELARARIAHAADEDDGDQLTLFDRTDLKPAAPTHRQLSIFDLGEEHQWRR